MNKTQKKTEQDYKGLIAYIRAARSIRSKTVQSKCLLLYYATQCNDDGFFFKSTVEIAAETGLGERTVTRINADWQTKGILKWTKGNSLTRKSNEYTLSLAKLQELAASSQKAAERDKETAKEKAAARSKRYRERVKEALEKTKRIVTAI